MTRPQEVGTFLISMRYLTMLPTDQEKIADLRELIARAEERVRKMQTRASEPGTSRMVHALTNSIRKHRRELHKRLARLANPTIQDQLRDQQRLMQRAEHDAPADRSSELLERQDQEPRKPAAQQGAAADQ